MKMSSYTSKMWWKCKPLRKLNIKKKPEDFGRVYN